MATTRRLGLSSMVLAPTRDSAINPSRSEAGMYDALARVVERNVEPTRALRSWTAIVSGRRRARRDESESSGRREL